jgi:hypothetical protein
MRTPTSRFYYPGGLFPRAQSPAGRNDFRVTNAAKSSYRAKKGDIIGLSQDVACVDREALLSMPVILRGTLYLFAFDRYSTLESFYEQASPFPDFPLGFPSVGACCNCVHSRNICWATSHPGVRRKRVIPLHGH